MSSRESEPDLGRTEAYDYDLPRGRIAKYPTERRDESRLLVAGRGERDVFQDLRFRDLPSLLRPGDLLVLNESRVLPVRLLGTKPTGAECEILLLRPLPAPTGAGSAAAARDTPGFGAADVNDGAGAGRRWEALVRPGAKLKPGRRVRIASDLEVEIEASLPGGERVVRLVCAGSPGEALERHGRIPLPPYLEREDEPLDRERYQTVYAARPGSGAAIPGGGVARPGAGAAAGSARGSELIGSVAAPTAGLHFTEELLRRVAAAGVGVAKVTLHVGPGTFRPVESDTLRGHRMHGERWVVPAEAARAIRDTRGAGGRVWAVGTTVVRTLESAASKGGEVREGEGETKLFIAPGYRMRTIDGLITNFHLPRSTLLMLVAAFAGYRTTMAAYEHAIAEGYRFYSYGDAMAVTPGPDPT